MSEYFLCGQKMKTFPSFRMCLRIALQAMHLFHLKSVQLLWHGVVLVMKSQGPRSWQKVFSAMYESFARMQPHVTSLTKILEFFLAKTKVFERYFFSFFFSFLHKFQSRLKALSSSTT